MLAAPCYSEKYYEVEVYQALLSIALIHVQVMLNFCTTLVSSATRATIKEKKKESLSSVSTSEEPFYGIQKTKTK